MVLIGVLGQDGRREAESIQSVIHSLVSIFIDVNKLSPVVLWRILRYLSQPLFSSRFSYCYNWGGLPEEVVLSYFKEIRR